MQEVERLLGHVLLQQKLLGENLLLLFMALIIYNSIKKFYNSVMVRSEFNNCRIKFIFSTYKNNYQNLKHKKKILVIFRGINVDYFDPNNKT